MRKMTTIPMKYKIDEYINVREDTSTETEIKAYIDRLDKAKDTMALTEHVCSIERVVKDLSINCKQSNAPGDTVYDDASKDHKQYNLFKEILKREETRQTYKTYPPNDSENTLHREADIDEEQETSDTVMVITKPTDLIEAENMYVTMYPKYETKTDNSYEIKENKPLSIILKNSRKYRTSIIEENIEDHKEDKSYQYEYNPEQNISLESLETVNTAKEINSKEIEMCIKIALNEFLNSLKVAQRLLLKAKGSNSSQYTNNLLIEIKAVKSVVIKLEKQTKPNQTNGKKSFRTVHSYSGENLEKLNSLSQMSDTLYFETFGKQTYYKCAKKDHTTKVSFGNKVKDKFRHYHDKKNKTEINMKTTQKSLSSENIYAKRKKATSKIRTFVRKKSNVDYRRKMLIKPSNQLFTKMTDQIWLHLTKQISRKLDNFKDNKVNTHLWRDNILDEYTKNPFESNEKEVKMYFTMAQNSLSTGDLEDAELIFLGIDDTLIAANNFPVLQALLKDILSAKSSKIVSNRDKLKRECQPKINLIKINKDEANKCTETAMRAIENAERLLLKAYRIYPIEQTKIILEKVRDIKTFKYNSEDTHTNPEGKIPLNSMSINKDDANKCMSKARSAFSTGNIEKAERLLKKANRMCPSEITKKLCDQIRESFILKNATEDTTSQALQKNENIFNMDDIRKSLADALNAFSADNFEKAERILIDIESKWPSGELTSLLIEIIAIKSSKGVSNNEPKYDQTLKETNKEEADKCIKMAEDAFIDGNAEKVERMLSKADRMHSGSNAKVILALVRVATALYGLENTPNKELSNKTTTKENPTSDNVENEEHLQKKGTRDQPEHENDSQICGTLTNPILRWTRLLHLNKEPEEDFKADKTLLDLDTRAYVVMELYDTEKNYVKALDTLVKNYLQPLKHPAHVGLLDPAAVDEIFEQVPAILSVHRGFLQRIARRLERWHQQQIVGDVFLEVFTKSIVTIIYTSFISNFQKSMDIIKTSAGSRPAFAKFLDSTARKDKGRMTLDGLLIKLVQKIPGYKLMLQRLIKYTDASHPDYSLLLEAQEEIHVLLEAINTTNK